MFNSDGRFAIGRKPLKPFVGTPPLDWELGTLLFAPPGEVECLEKDCLPPSGTTGELTDSLDCGCPELLPPG